MSRNPCVDIARRLALFRGVSERRIGAATRDARLVSLRSGDALVRRGEALPGLCALAAGSLKLTVSVRPRDERVLGLIAAGESFGEAAAVRDAPAPFDAVAVTDAQVLAIPLEAIELLVRRDAAFARNLLDRLAAEILGLLAGIEAGMLQRAPQRLASYLCTLAGSAGASVRRVSLPVSKTVVAAMLGMKKETLSRLLRDLSERRLIAVSRREITILDRARLEGVR
ncbi:MAG TPA: Crp/Fnr family transcriptional regulator [Burkholderiales bacterium]|jgi:CRP-like cAMP-binding protein